MFGIDYTELLVIGIVALVVVGPKDLPRLLYTIGQWVGRARSMARHVRTGIDAMVREAELEEMNKRWAAQNAAIMAASDPASEPDHDEDSRMSLIERDEDSLSHRRERVGVRDTPSPSQAELGSLPLPPVGEGEKE